MAMPRLIKAFGTVLLKVAAFWILLVATYLALGRQFFPAVERYDVELATLLSDQLGVQVSIGSLAGQWRQFNPILIAEDVRISDTLSVERVLLEPSLMQSLVTLSPVFKRFELSGFKASLVQTEAGWALSGMGAGTPAMTLEQLIALIRQQREVNFTDLAVNIEPSLLPGMTVTMESGLLTGFGDDNWMRAQANVIYDGLTVPIELQLESTRLNNQYEVDVYARHGEFDVAPWLQKRLPNLQKATLAAEYWVSLTRDQWQSIQVRLQSPAIEFSGRVNELALNNLETELFAERTAEGMDLWMTHVRHDMDRSGAETTRSQGEFAARASLRQSQWKLQWDQLPFAPISAFLALNDASGYWRTAFPNADVSQGKLSYRIDKPDSLRLTAQVNDLSILPHAGIPGVSGVNGNLRAEGSVARLTFDNTDVGFSLPGIYQQPFLFEQISGTLDIRWAAGAGIQLEGRHQAVVAPTVSQLAQGLTAQPVNGLWRVDVSRDTDREIGFRLSVDSQATNASWVKRLTPDNRIPGQVKPWVADNIRSGQFSDLAFSFVSGFSGGQLMDSGLALSVNFDDAVIRFNDAWPDITGGSGRLTVSLTDLAVDASAGNMAGVSLQSGRLQLPFSRPRLEIDLGLDAPADVALAMFQPDGPLDYLAGEVLEDWSMTGRTRANLSLTVPLNDDPLEVTLSARLMNGTLDINDLDLSLSDLRGDIGYTANRGLYADRLDGDLFGSPHRASLRSELTGTETSVTLSVEGETPLAQWGQWLGDPWLSDQPYQVAAKARLDFLSDQTRIAIQSDLVNLPLALPLPLGKTAQQNRPLILNLVFTDGAGLAVTGQYQRDVKWALDWSPQLQLEGGTVAMFTPLLHRDQPGLYLDAFLAEADIDEWRKVLRALQFYYSDAMTAAVGADTGAAPYIVREVNLVGDVWRGYGFDWIEPQVKVLSSDVGWLVTLDASELRGRVLLPFNGDPHFADFDFVNVNRSLADDPAKSAEPVTDPMLAMRPNQVSDTNIQIASLSVDGKDIGSWRGEVRRSDDTVTVRNLSGDMPDARLKGELTWRYLNNQHRSQFKGRVLTGNILNVLQQWDYAPVLESQTGQFDLDFAWPGTPAFFDYTRLRGSAELRLTNGSILELDEYEGVKLVGLLNFTRVLRRLALDFSDLIREGISFDVIEGELLFDRGFARVGDRLLIDGPSTKFRFSGDVDLVRDVLDVDMVMTVPLSSTFPLVALLAGVTPQAAAAIYVTERVFNNELERLSSVRMHVEGSLEAPELRFYRVFDNNTGSAVNPTVGDRLRNVVPTNPDNPGSP